MTVIVGISIGVVMLTAVLGFIRAGLGPDDATRAVVADLLYFCAVGVFVLVAMLTGSAVLFDVVLIASLLGILATVALARMLTRGER